VVSTYIAPLGGERIGDTLLFKYTVINNKLKLSSSDNGYVGSDVSGSSVWATIKALNSSDLSLLFDTTTVIPNGTKDETQEAAHFTKM